MQAPKQRSDARGGPDRRRLLLLTLGAVAAIVVVAVALVGFAGGGSGSPDERVDEAMRAAGCTVERATPKPYRPPNLVHIPTLDTKVTWNTDPPGGGAHFGQIAVWQFYDEPVDPKLLMHNAEHGGVIVWWGPNVDAETVDRLRDFYEDDPVSMIGTPYKPLGDRVAISAWTGDPQRYGSEETYMGTAHSATCPSFDEEAFRVFRDAYRGKGPEGVPMEQNQPGA